MAFWLWNCGPASLSPLACGLHVGGWLPREVSSLAHTLLIVSCLGILCSLCCSCRSSDSTLVYSLLSLRLISDRHLGISTQICPWQLCCKYPIGFSVPLSILCPHKIMAFAQSLKSSIWKSCLEFLPHHSHPADHLFLQVMPALFCSLSSYPSP